MKENIIVPAQHPIDWEKIPHISIDEQMSKTPTDVAATAQICYDDKALYLRLSAWETEIRAEEEGPLASPCFDSCLEFFFSPCIGDLRYFNMEWNPVKALYLGFGTCIEELNRLILDDPQTVFQPEVSFREDGWEINFQVPYAFIRRFFPEFVAHPGLMIRANFYKCGDKTTNPHYLAWNRITRVGRSVFHTPTEFGTLIFGENPVEERD